MIGGGIAAVMVAGLWIGQLKLLSRDLRGSELSGVIWGTYDHLNRVRMQIVRAMRGLPQGSLDYDERIAMARTRLINKAGQKDLTLKPQWGGGDRFDKEAINRQAHREVRHAYLNDHVRIDREEARDIAQIIEASTYSRAVREKPRRDFARATDRRLGSERRTRSRD